jgi:membrane fusion protein, hemolysin D
MRSSAKAAITAAKNVTSFPLTRKRREADERAFLPAALEIVETPPSPIGRAIAVVIAALFCLAVIWAIFGYVDIIAYASGKVVPSGRVKLIQPFETGVVSAIHVHDGQSVKAGEVLIELDPSIAAAEQAQKEAERDTISVVIEKLEADEPIIAQRVDIWKTLTDKALGSKITYLETLQQLTDNHRDTAIQKSRLAEANAAVATITARMKRLILTSPVDGVVQQLAVHTVGGVVTPAQQLAVVVPSDAALEVEAMVSNRDIGFVHVGQDAQIKIDTFNFTRYGLLHGRVLSVSQDAIVHNIPTEKTKDNADGAESTSSEPKGQELTYAARVSLDQTQIQVDGAPANLSAGMAVTVEIKSGSRSAMSYLLSPVLRYVHESMHER